MSNQGCEGGLALGQEGTVQWEVTREYNTEPRAAARPEPELLTNAPVSLRVLTGMSSLEQRWRWYGNEGSFHPTALPGVSCIRTLTEGFMVSRVIIHLSRVSIISSHGRYYPLSWKV